MVNWEAINNVGYANHAPVTVEPEIVNNFNESVRKEDGIQQIFQQR
jgi:hypothetical protein